MMQIRKIDILGVQETRWYMSKGITRVQVCLTMVWIGRESGG